tara:strand:- start:14005 stop:15114 length:1110 start_codon:yes stop_codon:yes gene_type:complete
MLKVELPISKSIANRYFIKCAIHGQVLPNYNDNWSDDIKSMHNLLSSQTELIDVGSAGTVFRFGIAYWSAQQGVTKILTGDERLLERPIDPLINSLKGLGAVLNRLEDGSWRITGKKLTGGKVKIDSSLSSQFESALLLIEPLMASKLEIEYISKGVSLPYVEMTKLICENSFSWPLEYDWSNSWIWIARSTITHEEILLKGLSNNSIQGDSICSTWANIFGFELIPGDSGIMVKGLPRGSNSMNLNFISCPDLVQVAVALAIVCKIQFSCSGLETLVHKETDRFRALTDALILLGIEVLDIDLNRSFSFDSTSWKPINNILNVSSSGDHRMSFFWAIIGLKQSICISDRETVSKSYPGFWEQWELESN